MSDSTNEQEKASPLDRLRKRRLQLDAEIKRREAAASQRRRKDETARKIEVGALALEHMRENPDSEVYRTLWRLLNRYVPHHRRHLFTDEFGISSLPPAKSQETSDAAANDASSPDESGGSLRHQFRATP